MLQAGKVADSVSDEVIGFFFIICQIPTAELWPWDTKNLPGGKGRPVGA
jgi:hypothetical protein